MFSVTSWPSEARTRGELRIFVVASVITALSRAPGKVAVEKSLPLMRLRFGRLTVVLVLEVEPVPLEVLVEIAERGD